MRIKCDPVPAARDRIDISLPARSPVSTIANILSMVVLRGSDLPGFIASSIGMRKSPVVLDDQGVVSSYADDALPFVVIGVLDTVDERLAKRFVGRGVVYPIDAVQLERVLRAAFILLYALKQKSYTLPDQSPVFDVNHRAFCGFCARR